MRCLLSLIMLSWLFVSGCSSIGKQTIPVYVYHRFPPFVIADQTDLSESLVKHLNRETPYSWQLHVVSRADLNKLRSQGQPMAILWGNPKWFNNDPTLLASAPILWDSDVMVYNHKRPLLGEFPTAVLQKIFCAVTGQRYAVLEDLIAANKIQQLQRDSLDECMALLLQGKVDFVQIEKSSMYVNYANVLGGQIGILNPITDTFHRVTLLDQKFAEALPSLNRAIAHLKNDPAWQKELAQFGEERFVDLFDLQLDDLLQIEIKDSAPH